MVGTDTRFFLFKKMELLFFLCGFRNKLHCHMWYPCTVGPTHPSETERGCRRRRDGRGAALRGTRSGRKAETPLGHSHANMNLKATSTPDKRTNKKADTDRVGYPGGEGAEKAKGGEW